MSFLSQFRFEPFPQSLQSAEVRLRLEGAVLAGDAGEFCRLLSELCPDLGDQYRLFGVMVRNQAGMDLRMVDQTGQAVAGDTVIGVDVPMHILNLEFTSTGLKVLIDGHVWHAKTGEWA